MLTQEELLRKAKAMRAQPVSSPNGTMMDMAVPQPQPTPLQQPIAQPAPPQMQAVADPRLAQASDLERQAAPPPGPQGFQQNLVNGIRSGLEGFAGGYTGRGGYQQAQALRDQQEHQRQQDLYTRAKELRGEAGQQQQLDLQRMAENRHAQTEQDTLEQTKRLRDIEQDKANRPQFQHFGTAQGGEIYGSTDTQGQFTKQGEIAPAVPNTKPSTAQQEMDDWLSKNPGKGPADFGDHKATVGQRPRNQIIFGDDPNNPGKQGAYEYNQDTGSIKPKDLQRTPTATSTAIAKEGMDAKQSWQSVHALEGLAKQDKYISDVAMADQFFNVIKPGTGARMNKDYINMLMTPGPLTNKMTVWAEKLKGGQRLTAEDRQYMIDAARTVAETKGAETVNGVSTAAPKAGGGPAIGTVKGGYVYKGGDPAKPESWKKQ